MPTRHADDYATYQRRLKILVAVPRLHLPGGVAHYYSAVRRHFSDSVTYVHFGSESAVEIERGTSIRRLVADYIRFWRELRRTRYDLVLLNPSLSPKCLIRDAVFLVIAKSAGQPVVVFIRGWSVGFQCRLERWWSTPFKLIFFRASAFIVLSNDFKEFLTRMGYTKPIFVETTTVEDEALDDSSREPDGNRFNILFLARLESAKGIYEAIDAYCILKTRYPNVTLTIAGDGPEGDRIRNYLENVRTVSNVTLLGHVTSRQKQAAFAEADVYLFPSNEEGMPNSVLEAMVSGLPVVTRRIGGLRDFFEDGVMGFSCEGNDPSVFAAFIEALMLDRALAQTIGDYNRRYARARFAASEVARRVQAICRSVLTVQTNA